jgi:hypothetical protein
MINIILICILSLLIIIYICRVCHIHIHRNRNINYNNQNVNQNVNENVNENVNQNYNKNSNQHSNQHSNQSNITKQMKVFLVSLEKDKERRDNLGIIPDYIYAVDGSKLDIDKLKADNILSKTNTLRKGEIGCYMSHVELLKKAIQQEDKYVLILEDDAKIEPDTFGKINELLKDVPDDAELIFIGYNYYETYKYQKSIYLHGTQSYIVNVRNLNLDKINKLYPIEKPIDTIIPKHFVTYIILPKIVELSKYASYSNTQNIN